MDAVAQRSDEVFAKQSELHVEVMFRVVVASLDDVSTEERLAGRMNVGPYVGKYAHLSEVVRRRFRAA